MFDSGDAQARKLMQAFVVLLLICAGAEKESDKWYCRICKKDNVAVLKSAQKVSGRTVNGGNIIVADDRNRRVRHFQAPDSVGGCAICK